MVSEVLARGNGYSIERDGDVLRLSRARGGGYQLGTYITAGLAALLAINGVVQLALGHIGAGVIILVIAALAAVAARALARVRVAPAQLEIRDGQLRGPDGAVLAPLGEAALVTKIDWTDGMGGTSLARVLWLRWPGGRAPIYKSYDKQELAALRERLAPLGLRDRA